MDNLYLYLQGHYIAAMMHAISPVERERAAITLRVLEDLFGTLIALATPPAAETEVN